MSESLPGYFLQILIYIHCITSDSQGIIIWDIQTGVVIRDIRSEVFGTITISGNLGTITLVGERDFFIYDGLNGGMLHKGQLQLSHNHEPSVQWVHKESLQFATRFKVGRGFAISIQELQPTSDPLSLTAKSFPVPSIDGEFSFSPVSFHASFVTKTEVVVYDVQGSKILFHTKANKPLYVLPGHFSPDGSFLACKTLYHNIYVWRNTPGGYVPWSTLQPRLPFMDFSFSPTAISILTWGPQGIQVLHPKNSVSSPSPNKMKSLSEQRDHLMACSVDGAHIVIARRESSVVTVLDSLLGTTVHSIHVGVKIQAIGIVDNTILVASGDKLISWNLGVGERAIAGDSHDITPISEYMREAGRLVLSNDCSQIAFAAGEIAVLYNIATQAACIEYAMDGTILDIQFSQDGKLLCVCSYGDSTLALTKFEMGEDGCLMGVTKECLKDIESWERFFPPSRWYHVTSSKWVVDPSGCKCLWLPPHWRTMWVLDVEFEHNFLALVGGHHQKPIIIELQPLPHSPLTHFPNISSWRL